MVVVYPRNLHVMFGQIRIYNSYDIVGVVVIVVIDVFLVVLVLVHVYVIAVDPRNLPLKIGQNWMSNS